jgi:hypothetical protein
VGFRIGALIFPNYAAPHSNGIYLVPLFAALAHFVALTVFWYACVRVVRALRPEWAPALQDPAEVQDEQDEWGDSGSEEEPIYIPPGKTYATNLGSTIDYEKFKLRNWKLFRKHRGQWPLFSIVFHYLSLAGMLANTIAFFWARDQNDWSTSRSWLVGGVLVVVWGGFFVGGQKLMWKLDWRRTGQNGIVSEPEGRYLH